MKGRQWNAIYKDYWRYEGLYLHCVLYMDVALFRIIFAGGLFGESPQLSVTWSDFRKLYWKKHPEALISKWALFLLYSAQARRQHVLGAELKAINNDERYPYLRNCCQRRYCPTNGMNRSTHDI